jgi:hypothetical protein
MSDEAIKSMHTSDDQRMRYIIKTAVNVLQSLGSYADEDRLVKGSLRKRKAPRLQEDIRKRMRVSKQINNRTFSRPFDVSNPGPLTPEAVAWSCTVWLLMHCPTNMVPSLLVQKACEAYGHSLNISKLCMRSDGSSPDAVHLVIQNLRLRLSDGQRTMTQLISKPGWSEDEFRGQLHPLWSPDKFPRLLLPGVDLVTTGS